MSDLEYINSYISKSLPFFLKRGITILISMPGNGTSTFAQDLYDIAKNSEELKGFDVDFSETRTKEEFKTNLINFAEKSSKNKYSVFSIYDYEEDYSDIFKNLNLNLIDNGPKRLVVASSPLPMWKGIVEKDYLVSKSIFILPLLTFTQAQQRLEQLRNRFDGSLDSKTIEKIYDISKGHGRLLKYLAINYFKDNSVFETKKLVELPDMQMALDLIYRGLPGSQWEEIYKRNLPAHVQSILKELGYIDDNGDVLIPLIKEYIDEIAKNKNIDMPYKDLDLSFREMVLLKKLVDANGEVVDRDRICEVLWGENWIDEYSDWALSQVIHNIRRAISTKNLPYEIKTVRGKGFVVVR